MSFEFVGYEAVPMEVNNGFFGQAMAPSMAPVGYISHGDGGHFGHPGFVSHPAPVFLRDALVEWPAAHQVRSFHIVKWRLCDDPKIREKIDKADQEVFRRNQDRLRITEALRAKRLEKVRIICQLKALDDEDKQLGRIIERKKPSEAREYGLCSSEQELNELLSNIRYQMTNCSAGEERRLTRETKRLELTRERVKSNFAMRAWILEICPDHAAQGQITEEALEEVKKKQAAEREKMKHLNGMIAVIEGEIKALEEDLADVIVRRDRAYSRIRELRKQRDDSNGFFYRNRAVFKDAKALADMNDVVSLEEVAKSEVEDFFSMWNSDRSFRENYRRRIQPSLDSRQLEKDGRRKGLVKLPSISEEGSASSGKGKAKAEAKGKGIVILEKAVNPEINVPESGADVAKMKLKEIIRDAEEMKKSAKLKEIIRDDKEIGKKAGDAKMKLKGVKIEEEKIEKIPEKAGDMKMKAKETKIKEDEIIEKKPEKAGDMKMKAKEAKIKEEEIIEKKPEKAEDKKVKRKEVSSEKEAVESEKKKSMNSGVLPSGAFGVLPSGGLGEAEEDDGAEMKLKWVKVVEEIEKIAVESEEKNKIVSSEVSGEDKEEAEDDEETKLRKREEEIEKAKKAMERKKKLAEKNAVKAAIKAQKDAEKKLKEREKKERKKTIGLSGTQEPAEAEVEAEAEEVEEKAKESMWAMARVKQEIYRRRDKFWRRHKPKASDPVLKAILKRRRGTNYWFWAVMIALVLAVITVFGYYLLFQEL